MKELWCDIPGYAGRYQVSCLGRVRSYAKHARPRILSAQVINSGYKVVHLHKPKRSKDRRIALVHRLVASAFCTGRTAEQNEINHKNGRKLDNLWLNLEWVSRLQNVQHSSLTGLLPDRKIKVVATKNGVEIAFDSLCEASVILLSSPKGAGNIHGCLTGRGKTAYGYTWRRA